MKIWEQREEKIRKNGEMNKKVENIINELKAMEETTLGESYRKIKKEALNSMLQNIGKQIKKVKNENTKEILMKMLSDIETRVDMKGLEVIIELLIELREEKGISTNKLSELSGLSGTYLWRLEKGERNNISVGKLKQITKVLDIDLSELFLKVEGKSLDGMFFLEKKEQKFMKKIRKMNFEEELSHEQVNDLVTAFKQLKK